MSRKTVNAEVDEMEVVEAVLEGSTTIVKSASLAARRDPHERSIVPSDEATELLGELEPIEARAVILLASGMRYSQIADELGRSPAWVAGLRRDDACAEALGAVRSDLVEGGRTALASLVAVAVDVLLDVMTDPGASDTAKVAAAKTVLDRVGISAASSLELHASADAAAMLVERGREVADGWSAVEVERPDGNDSGTTDADEDEQEKN